MPTKKDALVEMTLLNSIGIFVQFPLSATVLRDFVLKLDSLSENV